MVVCFKTQTIGVECERHRLPCLETQPFVLVCNNNLVHTACPLAQAKGVWNGLALTTARSLCKGLVVLPYDGDFYTETAERVWNEIAADSNTVEPLSPELCYADLQGADILSRVRQIAAAIAQVTAAPLEVGLGATKLIARTVASTEIAIDREREADLLPRIPVTSLPLDIKTIDRCSKLGLNTLGDIRKTPRRELERQFRQQAHRLSRLALGEDGDPVKAAWPRPTVEYSIRFDDEINDREQIDSAISVCAANIAEALVDKSTYCRSLRLQVGLAGGSVVTEAEKLTKPLHDATAINRGGLRLLQRLGIETPVTEITMSAHDLDIANGIQLVLLDTNDQGQGYPHERVENLAAATRYIRRRLGPKAVRSGGLMLVAQAASGWTFPLGKRRDEEIKVAVDEAGRPLAYYRGGTSHRVAKIMNLWRETSWAWGESTSVDCFRVLNEQGGTYELKCQGDEWRLSGVGD